MRKALWSVLVASVMAAILAAGCAAKSRAPSPAQPPAQPPQQETRPVGGAESQQAAEPAIPGLEPADIKVNLERTWKLRFTAPAPGLEYIRHHGEAVDPDTGARLSCQIYGRTPVTVDWAVFTVDATGVAGRLSGEVFNGLAAGFLGYAATVPYDGSEPQRAREWVQAHVKETNKPGGVLETQIGPVKFELSGGAYLRILKVKPAA